MAIFAWPEVAILLSGVQCTNERVYNLPSAVRVARIGPNRGVSNPGAEVPTYPCPEADPEACPKAEPADPSDYSGSFSWSREEAATFFWTENLKQIYKINKKLCLKKTNFFGLILTTNLNLFFFKLIFFFFLQFFCRILTFKLETFFLASETRVMRQMWNTQKAADFLG